MIISLFGESIGYINVCNSDVSTNLVSEKNGSVPSHPSTDIDTWRQMQGHWLVYLNLLFSMYQFFSGNTLL